MRTKNLIARLYFGGRRVTAMAFIVMLLVANFWFILRFTGESFPDWSSLVFFGSVFFVVAGFFMMLPGWLNPSKLQIESEQDSE